MSAKNVFPTIIIVACLFGCLYVICSKYLCRNGATCKIKFSDFKTWYSIAPDKWNIGFEDNTVAKFGYLKGRNGSIKHISTVSCYFGLLDYIRFVIWKNRRQIRSERFKRYQEKEQLLRLVQQDIDTVMEQVQRDREDASEVLRRATENPNPESPVEDFMKIWRGIKIH